MDWLLKIDRELFLHLNGAYSAFFDEMMVLVSGKLFWVPLYLVLLFLLIYKYKRSSWLLVVGVVALVILTDQTSVHLFKNVFQRLRPCHAADLQGLVHLVDGHCGGKYAFISSHAANVFGLAFFLNYFLGKKFKYFTLLIFIWASLVSYSRVYLGVHYPLDIICGAAWGGVLGYFLARFISNFKLLHEKG